MSCRPGASVWESTPDWVDWLVVERMLKGQKAGRSLTSAEKMRVAISVLRQGHEPSTGLLRRDVGKMLSLNGYETRKLMQAASARTGIPLRVEPDPYSWAV